MTTNFNAYGLQSERMNIADLHEGQTLVRIFQPKNHWGQVLGKFATVEYTVVKVLKTRLVLRAADGSGQELRLLVDNKKWSIRAGEVTTANEGSGDNWNRTEYQFATQGDPVIEALRQQWEERIAEDEARNAAKAAVAEVRHELDGMPDLEKIDAAIEKLVALRTMFAQK